MKPFKLIIIILILLLPDLSVRANTLNEVVKEARQQGQVLSAKTRQGMHEVRVVTPQGSVKTIRKPVSQNNLSQRQPNSSSSQNYYQPPTQSLKQQSLKPTEREYRHSRQPEFRRFQRSSQTPRVPIEPQSIKKSPIPQRRQPAASRSDDRDPD